MNYSTIVYKGKKIAMRVFVGSKDEEFYVDFKN
jgi:hypothetical protein